MSEVLKEGMEWKPRHQWERVPQGEWIYIAIQSLPSLVQYSPSVGLISYK